MYKVIIDGKEACTGNSVGFVKKQANREFDLFNSAFYAEIRRGNKLYAYRWYNSEWKR